MTEADFFAISALLLAVYFIVLARTVADSPPKFRALGWC